MRILTNREIALIDKGHHVLKEVLEYCKNVDDTLKWKIDEWLNFWDFQFNPDKGETAISEKEKYIKLLYDHNSISVWEDLPGRYVYFTKIIRSAY